MEAILSTAYFAPVQWYQKLYRYDKCLIETNESYQKQTYRNRCVIATANGRQTLTVPVEHTGKHGGIPGGLWEKKTGFFCAGRTLSRASAVV